jgi:hypothetical protein
MVVQAVAVAEEVVEITALRQVVIAVVMVAHQVLMVLLALR